MSDLLNEASNPETTSSAIVDGSNDTTTSEATESTSSFLPESLRENPSLKDFKDVEGLAKSYLSTKEMVGSSIRIPGEDAGDDVREAFYNKLSEVPGIVKIPDTEDAEGWDTFYQRLGRPEAPDSYKLEVPEDIPIDENIKNEFFQMAHKAGLTQAQASAVAQWELDHAAKTQETVKAGAESAKQVLQEKWGADYDARMQGATAVAKVYAEKYPEAVAQLLDDKTGNGNNPAFISMLADLAGYLKESGSPAASTVNTYGISAEEALERISEIRRNPAHPHNNPADPQYAQAVKKMSQLYSIAYPD